MARVPRAIPGRSKAWNHNIAYFSFIERVARERARRSALDVGTGDGMLAAALSEFVPVVVGLDLHQEQVDAAAAAYGARPGLRFAAGDLLTTRLREEPFDFVAASAVLHHMELLPALHRLRELTAPGGTLAIVGLATNQSALDWILSGLAVVPARLARARRGWHEHGAPKMDPRDSWGDIRKSARALLPGARFRRRLYWRYSLVWNNDR
jgi:SAM-dependent methyltransferase